MAKPFRDALLDFLARKTMTLPEIAARSGVSLEQLKKVRQRETASTNVDDALKVSNACGFSLDEFLEDDTQARRDAIVAQYNRLTEQERDLLRALALGRAARNPAA
jgi:transcriptional regulator with XRE-family HTH domain